MTEKRMPLVAHLEELRKRLTEIYNYPRYTSPMRAGEYYFFNKNDGLQNQAVLYKREGLDGKPEVLYSLLIASLSEIIDDPEVF